MLAVGFVLLALWQLTELFTQHEKFDKAKAGGKLVLYAALAWTTFTFAIGGRTSSNKQTKDFTVTLMDAPGRSGARRPASGSAILAIAGYHVYKGWKEKFLEDLQEHPGHWAVVAGRGRLHRQGHRAWAPSASSSSPPPIQHRAGRRTGLDGALRSMRDLPAGTDHPARHRARSGGLRRLLLRPRPLRRV